MSNDGTTFDWPSYLSKCKSNFLKNWAKEEELPIHTRSELTFLQTIGKGGFSDVVLARKGKNLYAVKVMKKSMAMSVANFSHVMNEKRSLQATQFPFLIHMEFHFTDNSFIYFVTPYIPGGDLWHLLRKCLTLSEHNAQFYITQVILAVEYLHYMDIIYRDLKPENIFINADGYIKLGDLGFCKRIKARTYTMCGTTQYMAPEVLLNLGYGFAVDWWSLGVLIYELGAGYTPFLCRDESKMCDRITRCDYVMENCFSKELQDLIQNLLQSEPSRRLGNLKNGVEGIKHHPWFNGVNWLDVFNKRLNPPFIPEMRNRTLQYVQHFDTEMEPEFSTVS